MLETIAEKSTWVRISALFGASAVALGAFGSHGLRHLVSTESLAIWRVGVEYQMFHALAMLALSVGATNVAKLRWSLSFWSVGCVLFSGSLYAMATSGWRSLGAITPIGGLCFIGGWLVLAWFPQPRREPAATD